ncbi:MAG: 3'-5' exonuclease [Candidatus Heimdallarchaeota archaeon]|nr:3'-5' exonuclease [Candidatus Heimdallarchaeota archaeon]MCK4770104.1 3'-5' exonuclease [Candidatus Heimdallarchaeota archaeon]
MDIYVVDIETTGLDGWPKDYVVEIAIMRANVLKQEVEQVYHSVIHHDISTWDESILDSWIFKKGIISVDEIKQAKKDLATVSGEVRKLLSNKFVAAYNNAFDFDKFLKHEPWDINDEKNKSKIAPCIMLTASEYVKLPSKYKKRKIIRQTVAKKYLLNENTECIRNNKDLEKELAQYGEHRANYDAFYAACILLELYRKNQYRVYPRVYYAHSLNIYRSKQERKELKLIKRTLSKAEIINPAVYEKKWKKSTGKEIMKRCLDLMSNSDIVVFSAIEQENKYFVGKGVFIEVKFAEELGMEIYFISEELEKKYTLDMYDDNDWSLKFGIVKLKKQIH